MFRIIFSDSFRQDLQRKKEEVQSTFHTTQFPNNFSKISVNFLTIAHQSAVLSYPFPKYISGATKTITSHYSFNYQIPRYSGDPQKV